MLNEVKLIGRLGAAPDIREVNGSSKVATLNVATWESFRPKNDPTKWETITEWHRVVVWNVAAERCAKMEKGNLVLVTGKIKNRSYDDKDGVKRYITEIVGFVRVMPKIEGTAPTISDTVPVEEPKITYGSDDDLPF